MAATSEIAGLLRNLGLTETEAEVYVALLKASHGEAISGYRVARDMGRDPANLAKILAALVRRGAVRVIQEKPRLFLPVPADEFTGGVLEKMADTQRRAVELLREFDAAPAAGTALALAGPEQVLERARLMLGNCRAEALAYGSPEVCERLTPLLEDLAAVRGCRVRVLSTRAMGIAGAETVSLPLPAGVRDPEQTPWLQLVVDREIWLLAQLRAEGTPQTPSGWWGEDSGLAFVTAATLDAAGAAADAQIDGITAPRAIEPVQEPVQEAVVEPVAEPMPEPTPEAAPVSQPEPEPEPTPEAEPEPVFEPEPLAIAEPEPQPATKAMAEGKSEPVVEPVAEPMAEPTTEPTPPPKPEPDSEDDDGFEFIIRHDEKD